MDEDVRTEIVARGGLEPLLRLSSSDDVEIQMEVTLRTGNLFRVEMEFVEFRLSHISFI